MSIFIQSHKIHFLLLVANIGFLGLVVLGYSIFSPEIVFWGFLFLCLLILVQARVSTGHYSSVLFVFSLFFFLYSLSGPWRIISGRELPSVFGGEFNLSKILLVQSVAGVGLSVGIFAVSRVKLLKWIHTIDLGFDLGRPSTLIFIAIGFATISSLFEFLNFLRVGGVATLVSGKAVYQTKASDLSLTLPSFQFLIVGAAFAGLGLSRTLRAGARKITVLRTSGLLLILASPALMIALGLGRRGIVLAVVMVLAMSWFLDRPVSRIPKKLVAIGILVYLLMGLMYAARPILGYSYATGDWDYFRNRFQEKERLLNAIDPGMSEFGAPFGNLGIYEREGKGRLYLGETYLNGLASIVPGFMYPGDKPKQITYEFRDKYFPGLSKRGGITGSGFSAILEAYMNFGIIGVFLIYFLVGVTICLLENFRNGRSPVLLLAYAVLVPLAQSWHRSQFGFVLGWAFFHLFVLLFIVFFISFSKWTWNRFVRRYLCG